MAIQIFGSSKSFDTKKAQRWFAERRIPVQEVNLKDKGISAGELESVISCLAKTCGSLPPRRGRAWLQALSLKKVEVSRKRDLLISRDRT